MQKYNLQPALFIDLDGTVRRSKSGNGFIKGADDIELIEGVVTRIKAFKRIGFLIIAISNQGGIAYGHKTIDDVKAEMHETLRLFEFHGLRLPFDIIQTCPFMEGGTIEPYNTRSLFRKPDIGMLAAAEEETFKRLRTMINYNLSIFVGDREEDRICAMKAGLKYVHAFHFIEWFPEFLITNVGPVPDGMHWIDYSNVPHETSSIVEMYRQNQHWDKELKILHACITELYNNPDNTVGDRIKAALDEIEQLEKSDKAEV